MDAGQEMMQAKETGKSTIWIKGVTLLHKVPSVWLLVLPLVLLLPTLRDFPYPSLESAFSDITISHYPNAIFLRESIAEFRVVPLWSSTIMSGYPFAANPLSGLWYPPGWLALLLPLPLGFNLMIGLHLVWGGWGLYNLVRAEGLSRTAALLAGLSFGLLPKLFAHYGAGHLSLLYAVPWTPWLLLSQRRYAEKAGSFRIPPGVILAAVILADVRWGIYAMLAWWAYAIVHTQNQRWYTLRNLLLQSALGLLLSAPQLIPLFEYSMLSTRASLSAGENLKLSLPIANLLGLLFPNLKTDHEWVFYMGGTITILAVTGLLFSPARRRKFFWAGLCLVSLLVALGSQIPGSGLIAQIPPLSFLRVPARALFLAGIGFCSLAGYGVDALQERIATAHQRKFRLFLFSAGIFAMLLLLGYFFILGEVPIGLLWGVIGLLIGAVWIWLGVKPDIPRAVWLAGVVVIAVVDLGFVDLNSFAGKSAGQVLAESRALAEYIKTKGGGSRTYSPSYSLPQQTAVNYGVRLADGVDPLQIAEYTRFMDQATGVPRKEYSVTIPYFASGDPETDNAQFIPDADMLGLLDVGYIVSKFSLQAAGLEFDNQMDGVKIYRNLFVMGPAWVQTANNGTDEFFKNAKAIERSPNRYVYSAEGPGMLVISEIAYPGWSVNVDGVESEIQIREGILMGVEIGAGSHSVEFAFCPMSVYYGFLGFAVGICILIFIFLRAAMQGSVREFKPD